MDSQCLKEQLSTRLTSWPGVWSFSEDWENGVEPHPHTCYSEWVVIIGLFELLFWLWRRGFSAPWSHSNQTFHIQIYGSCLASLSHLRYKHLTSLLPPLGLRLHRAPRACWLHLSQTSPWLCHGPTRHLARSVSPPLWLCLAPPYLRLSPSPQLLQFHLSPWVPWFHLRGLSLQLPPSTLPPGYIYLIIFLIFWLIELVGQRNIYSWRHFWPLL